MIRGFACQGNVSGHISVTADYTRCTRPIRGERMDTQITAPDPMFPVGYARTLCKGAERTSWR